MKKINLNDEVNAKILQILDEHENDIIGANKALDALWKEEQSNATKDLMDMNEDYCDPNDILEDIDEFNPYKE